MNDLDNKIKEALGRERDQEETLRTETWGDQGIFVSMIDSFRGRLRGWILLMMVYTLIAFAAAVFCVWQFFTVTELSDQLMYGFGFITFMMMTAMLKMWYLMQLDKHSVLREIKRLELRVVDLTETLVKRN